MATWRIAKIVPFRDPRGAGHLEILQMTSPPKPYRIESKLDGRHHSDIGLSRNLMGGITVT